MGMTEQLLCVVQGCENSAIARVFPTNGATDHSALRCRDCLEADLDSGHFREWAAAIKRGGNPPMPEEYTVAEWQEAPYTSHERRGAVVQHRVVLFVYDHGLDVEHQVQGDAAAPVPSEWRPITVYEARDGRVQQLDRGQVLRP